MQIFTAGQSNTMTADVLARASGDPIVAGTVNGYLKALTGANAGKWWKASDSSWSATIVSAGVMAHDDDGHWTVSVVSGAWTATVRYRFTAKESTNLHIPVSEDVVDIPTSAAIADAVWDEILTKATHNVASSAGRRLRAIEAFAIVDGTAVSATSQTITLDSGASATANIYSENLIVITDGTGTGQSRMILEYTSLKVVTVDAPWDVVPDGTSVYQIIAFNGVLMPNHGLAQSGADSTITLATTALAVSDSYVGCAIYLAAGTGVGQTRLITGYTTGRIATVSPSWDTVPDGTTVYKVLAVGRSIVDSMSAAAVTAVRTELEANGTKLDHLWETTEDDAGVRRFTANALEQAPSSGGTVNVTMEPQVEQ